MGIIGRKTRVQTTNAAPEDSETARIESYRDRSRDNSTLKPFHGILLADFRTQTLPKMDPLRYPIGKFEHEGEITDNDIDRWIDQIAALPRSVRMAVDRLSEEQLDTPYRPGGWTVRQLVHHIGDSHMNSLVRFKWALTEDEPAIKAYDQAGWAGLADYRDVPLETSLLFLESLQARLVALLRSLSTEDLARRFVHPVSGSVTLARNIGLYAWHGRHHVAHISALKAREGWT